MAPAYAAAAIGITGPTQRMGFRERARVVKALRAGVALVARTL